MYNRENTAEILGDLRDGLKLKIGKKPTFKELSSAIQEKTGVYISNTSLCDYEKNNKDKDMSVKNLVALADFYDVSFDYLLGYSNSRERENVNINKKYGLTDKTLSRIEIMHRAHSEGHGSNQIDIFNALIESDEFSSLIDTLAKCPYAYELREQGIMAGEAIKQEVLATLTDKQRELIKEGKLLIIDPKTYFETLVSSLQATILQIAVEVSEK